MDRTWHQGMVLVSHQGLFSEKRCVFRDLGEDEGYDLTTRHGFLVFQVCSVREGMYLGTGVGGMLNRT